VDSQQGVVIQLGGWAESQQSVTAENWLVTKCYTGPQGCRLFWTQ